MAISIDPLSRVAPGAAIADGVEIGPFCTVGAGASLGEGVKLVSNVVVDGDTMIGARTIVHPFAVIGGPPQDLSYKGEPTRVEVGADCVIRESVTINRATPKSGLTKIGDRCFLMAYAHVAHDCRVGDNVVFANAATLGGHVEVGSFVFLGGLCAVHQFTRIGSYAMIGGLTGVKEDVIPFGMAFGANGVSGELIGLNVVGMRRRGFSRDEIKAAYGAYDDLFYGDGTFRERLERARRSFGDGRVAAQILAFIDANTKRPVMMAAPKRSRAADA